MLVLITYDVNTETPDGKKRLRQVAKACQDYGQRVQHSVFECEADSALMVKIKDRLIRIINVEKDSLRFYFIGNNCHDKIEHYGAKEPFDVTGSLIV